jgi:hypothetical protein
LTRIVRMESVQQGAAVQLTIPDVGVFPIPIVRRPLPRRGGFSILYRCPFITLELGGPPAGIRATSGPRAGGTPAHPRPTEGIPSAAVQRRADRDP